jgi:hypothetical protein
MSNMLLTEKHIFEKLIKYSEIMWRFLSSSMFIFSSVTYPAILRCDSISRGRCDVSCGCECGGCASLKEIIRLQWKTTESPIGDFLASPNFGICDATFYILVCTYVIYKLVNIKLVEILKDFFPNDLRF